ncbi:hypothetical protein VSDG_08544 [Cytospora chrysosperma]|uniref:Uncharacterized protein n=1 Tax=Cytospora chrysosperma TaxID=252740 RepID=A0A423VEY5_CYTCH|nr:hypothetical protein VSDG_08544 [Valsa sordida]
MGNNVSAPQASPAPVSTIMKPAAAPSQSRRSSVGSIDSATGAVKGMQSTATSSSASSICSPGEPAYPVDPLSRQFPKPTDEVNVAEMLERKPLKWTVGHYIKTPTREVSDPFEDKEKIAQDMEARKRELLAAKEELRRLSGQ